MEKQIIATDKAPAAVGPYSQGVGRGDFIFTAGQLGIVPGAKEFAGPDIETQTTVFLADIGEFSRMNAVYAQFFPERPPARSAVQVAALPLGGRVEIEAVALA